MPDLMAELANISALLHGEHGGVILVILFLGTLFFMGSLMTIVLTLFSFIFSLLKRVVYRIEIQNSEQTRVQAEKRATQVVALPLGGITLGSEPGKMALTVQMNGIELLFSDHQLTVLIAFIFISQF
ncbi:TPA: hypothetical protein O7V39_003429 [Salmonella enterica]|nr:hypothetical protein [Salmonella enterica]HDC1601906.1 hypothetical protein [Salmonella enterica]